MVVHGGDWGVHSLLLVVVVVVGVGVRLALVVRGVLVLVVRGECGMRGLLGELAGWRGVGVLAYEVLVLVLVRVRVRGRGLVGQRGGLRMEIGVRCHR